MEKQAVEGRNPNHRESWTIISTTTLITTPKMLLWFWNTFRTRFLKIFFLTIKGSKLILKSCDYFFCSYFWRRRKVSNQPLLIQNYQSGNTRVTNNVNLSFPWTNSKKLNCYCTWMVQRDKILPSILYFWLSL